MGKKKFYFNEFDDEMSWSLDLILDEMRLLAIKETSIFEVEREIVLDHFYCKAMDEVYIKSPEGEPCGNNCGDYKPRNKKSGCCIYRGYAYSKGKEFKLTDDGKITPVE
jgi:hypothetical protein